MANYNYTEEMIQRMKQVAAAGVTKETVAALAEEFNFSPRSVAAKLRSLEYTVPLSTEGPVFSAEETEAFKNFLNTHNATLTAAEIAEQFLGGKFNYRQITGKALTLEMMDRIKKAEKAVKPRTYTPDEEALITKLVDQGKFIEDIAEALNKDIKSIRGKLLSMDLTAPQKVKKVVNKDGLYPNLEALAPTMTVEELQAHYEKDGTPRTIRGIKTAISRRKIQGKDYPSSKKSEE